MDSVQTYITAIDEREEDITWLLMYSEDEFRRKLTFEGEPPSYDFLIDLLDLFEGNVYFDHFARICYQELDKLKSRKITDIAKDIILNDFFKATHYLGLIMLSERLGYSQDKINDEFVIKWICQQQDKDGLYFELSLTEKVLDLFATFVRDKSIDFNMSKISMYVDDVMLALSYIDAKKLDH